VEYLFVPAILYDLHQPTFGGRQFLLSFSIESID
jgi:hypothetical protein